MTTVKRGRGALATAPATIPAAATRAAAQRAVVPPRAGRGRPRSEVSHRAVLDAARTLMRDRAVRDITIDALAKCSGVGRPTIYRWWPSATAVVLDAFLEEVSATFATPVGSGTAAAALEQQIVGIARVLRGAQGRVIAELLAEGQSDGDLLTLFRERFLLRRREAVRAILERGMASGEFSRALDPELAIDLITGPAYLRLLTGHQPVSEAFARALVAHVLRTLAPGRPDPSSNAG